MVDPQHLRAWADDLLGRHEAGDLAGALRVADELLAAADTGDPHDPVVRETIFAARFERALLLTELGDLTAAAAAYADAARAPADLGDPDQRHEVAMALLNRGICLEATGDPTAALRAYDDLLVRFGTADDPVTADQVVRGRVNRAAVLLDLGEVHEALTVVDALIAELDPLDALDSEQLAMAVRLRAAALRALGRIEEAAAVLADVERCNDDDPAARLQVASAQRERGELLVELGRGDEALRILEHAAARLEGDPDPVIVDALREVLGTEADVLERVGDLERAAQVRSRVPH